MRSPWFFLARGFCVRRDNDVGIGFDLAWLLKGGGSCIIVTILFFSE